jgi:MYXO-CTERM domain-containing protein
MPRTIAFASVLMLGSIAHAQAGSCTGSLSGTVGLAVPVSGKLVSVAPQEIPFIFGAAECACADSLSPSTAIHAEIKLTQALPAGTSGTVEVWVGNGCESYTVRATANQVQCEKIATLDITDFSTAATNQGLIEVPLPPDSLYSPLVHDCGAGEVHSNNVYVIAFTDPALPFAACQLELTESSVLPARPVNVSVGATDAQGMAHVTWTTPPVGQLVPSSYQLLCSPAHKLRQPNGFNDCHADGKANRLFRRALELEAGTSATAGGEDESDDGAHLVACSPLLAPTAGAARLGPITAPTQIRVAAIDNYGNMTLSSPVDVTPPTPEEQLISRHGCSIGGAGAIPPWAALALLVALALRRRRAAAHR